jgi:hypothetical protein
MILNPRRKVHCVGHQEGEGEVVPRQRTVPVHAGGQYHPRPQLLAAAGPLPAIQPRPFGPAGHHHLEPGRKGGVSAAIDGHADNLLSEPPGGPRHQLLILHRRRR